MMRVVYERAATLATLVIIALVVSQGAPPALVIAGVAAVVPLAAVIYLATTTMWTLVERAILRRRYWDAVA